MRVMVELQNMMSELLNDLVAWMTKIGIPSLLIADHIFAALIADFLFHLFYRQEPVLKSISGLLNH